ncbi:saccharopine dehydrogenase C-terminal domain-containing protein [Acidobacteriota bacterium]
MKKTYRQLIASLIGAKSTDDLEQDTAKYLKVHNNADIIHRLKWLGLFDDRTIDIREGTKLDVLLDRMLKKMAYQPHEKDMIILHIEVIAEFPGPQREKRLATYEYSFNRQTIQVPINGKIFQYKKV